MEKERQPGPSQIIDTIEEQQRKRQEDSRKQCREEMLLYNFLFFIFFNENKLTSEEKNRLKEIACNNSRLRPVVTDLLNRLN